MESNTESNVKTEPEDDEENGRTTPVREYMQRQVIENKAPRWLPTSLGTNIVSPSNKESAEHTLEKSQLDGNAGGIFQVDGKIQEQPECNDSSQVTTTPNLVKEEAQDKDLETTIALIDGQSTNSTDQVVTPPANIAPPSFESNTMTNNVDSSSSNTNTAQPSLDSGLVKREPMDTDMPPVEEPPVNSEQIVIPSRRNVAPPSSENATEAEHCNTLVNNMDNSNSNTQTQSSLVKTEPLEEPSGNTEPTPPRPTISIVPMNRLRVKPEFSALPEDEPPTEPPSLPNDFFDDILPQNMATTQLVHPKEEPIPTNFFDDILVDRAQERIEAAETEDLEIKFGDRLKLLEELERKLRKEREKKKHKKAKKKSRKRLRSSDSPSPSKSRRSNSRSASPKRRRSRSRSPPTRRHRSHSRSPPARRHRSRSRSPPPRKRSATPERRKQKLMRWPEISEEGDRTEKPSTSKRHQTDIAVSHESRTAKELLLTVPDIEIHDQPVYEGLQPHLPEIRDDCTVRQKRDRALMRAKTMLDYLSTIDDEKESPMSTFLFTSTVRKLPASYSYRNQHVYENRSPLHNINNVRYKFNSHARRFNMEEWGLASLPPHAAKIAKLVGFDAETVHNKLKLTKIPAKIRKIIREDGQSGEDDEELMEHHSSLFCCASTQTDEMLDAMQRKPASFDIGVQVARPSFDIACQTLETESPSVKLFDNCDDLPIMSLIREMNDNQLMALHDFAELLQEPPTKVMDMYKIRQRMLDIYKCGQQPSTLGTASQRSLNNYSASGLSPSARVRNQDQSSGFMINSVEGGDGSFFSVNDARANFIGNSNRNHSGRNNPIRNVQPNDPRISSHRPERREVNDNRANHQMPNRNSTQASTGKYYGRGGLRR
ncbi:uncharacterized protein LOC142229177 [Haematobia irritans]|uniref:uncharacterized protein LOC142229177 n=1 Tax=Haematobia irritans TaxID=7368 RepID=UPI003F50D16B